MIRLVKLRRGTKARRFATLAALVPLLAASTTTQVFANSGPTASFAYSPSYPVAGQPVSFDGSVSTCDAGPCTYTWTDDADGSQLGTGVAMAFTYQEVGTKYARLTVRDIHGRTASVEHDLMLALQGFTAAFTYSPSSPVTGQPVAFNGSASSCVATPCAYAWTDDADRSRLGTGVTMSFTFQHVGTKYVRLTITDALGQTGSVEHDVVVAAPDPTPTPTPTPMPTPTPTPTSSPAATPVASFTYRPSNL